MRQIVEAPGSDRGSLQEVPRVDELYVRCGLSDEEDQADREPMSVLFDLLFRG